MSVTRIIKLLGGIVFGLVAWLVLVVCDYIDEIVLDTGLYLGAFALIGFPIVLSIGYIIHYIMKKPTVKEVIQWHAEYAVTFSLVWAWIFWLVNCDKFFIFQEHRSEFIDLNGIEYAAYGITALGGFIVVSILFHIVYAIVNKVRKNRLVEGEN